MDLLYIWIKDYKNIFSNIGLNLSSEILVSEEFDQKEKVLTLDISPKNHVKYSKNITSLKTIIGENGTGKSSIIDMIFNRFGKNADIFRLDAISKIEGIVIFRKNSKFYEFKIPGTNIVCKSNLEKLHEVTFNDFMKSIGLIKYSSGFHANYKNYFVGECTTNFDISDDYLIRNKEINNHNIGRPNYSLLNFENILSISSFIFDESLVLNNNIFNKPNYIIVDFIHNIRRYLKYNAFRKIYNDSISSIKNDKKKLLIFCFSCRILINHNLENDNNIDFSDNSLKLYSDLKQISIILNENKNFLTEIIKSLDESTNETHSDDINIFFNTLNNISFELTSREIDSNSINDWFVSKKITKIETINSLKELVTNNFLSDCVQFKWGASHSFSSGEENLLLLFSRIYTLFKTDKFKGLDNIIFLLDEPEAYYHPKWKRTFVNEFLTFIDTLIDSFGTKKTTAQAIITSNSPYFISDIPSDDIILLNRQGDSTHIYSYNSNTKTFGANIHSLLKHSFFMDDTIGEFAKEKIKAVTKDLINKSVEDIEKEGDRKKEIEFIIDNVGEPIIQRKLQELYNKKFNRDKKSYEDEIAELKDKLSKAEKSPNSEDIDDIDNIIKKLQSKVDKMKENINNNN